jgi:hypothetical protein
MYAFAKVDYLGEVYMTQQKLTPNIGYKVEKHHELTTASEQEVRENSAYVLRNADQGIQTAVIGADGRVRAVVGLNGNRYLPDPDPDPLDEILRSALESNQGRQK